MHVCECTHDWFMSLHDTNYTGAASKCQFSGLDVTINEWKTLASKVRQICVCVCVRKLASVHSLKQMSIISAFSLNIDHWAKQGQQWLYSTSYVATQSQLPALVGIIWMRIYANNFNALLLLLSPLPLCLCLYSRCVRVCMLCLCVDVCA